MLIVDPSQIKPINSYGPRNVDLSTSDLLCVIIPMLILAIVVLRKAIKDDFE